MAADQDTRPKILITEDDPLLVKMYKTKLESEGYEVYVGKDGQEGLEIAIKQTPDLIILDMMLPRLSGVDFLAKLRQSATSKDIPVIVLSNLSQEDEVERAKQYGVKDYLIKTNFTPSQVIAKVKQYVKPQ